MSTVVSILVTLLVVSITRSLPFFNQYGDELSPSATSQFYCFKLKTCTRGPPRVCGHDADGKELHEFEDLCMLYMENCEHSKVYRVVPLKQCDEMKQFYKNNMSRWIYEDTLSKWFHDKEEMEKLLLLGRSTTETTTPGRFWSRDPFELRLKQSRFLNETV